MMTPFYYSFSRFSISGAGSYLPSEDSDSLGADGDIAKNKESPVFHALGPLSCDEKRTGFLSTIPSTNFSPTHVSRSFLDSVRFLVEWHELCENIFHVLTQEVRHFTAFLLSQGSSAEPFLKDLMAIERKIFKVFSDSQRVFEIGKLSVKENLALSESKLVPLILLFKKTKRSFINFGTQIQAIQRQWYSPSKGLPPIFVNIPDRYMLDSVFMKYERISNHPCHRELELVGALLFSEFVSFQAKERKGALNDSFSLHVRNPSNFDDVFFTYVKDFSASYRNCFEILSVISERADHFKKFLIEKESHSADPFLKRFEKIKDCIFKISSDIEVILERGSCCVEKYFLGDQLDLPKFTFLFREIRAYLIHLGKKLDFLEAQCDPSRHRPFYLPNRTCYFPRKPIDLPDGGVPLDGLFLEDLLKEE